MYKILIITSVACVTHLGCTWTAATCWVWRYSASLSVFLSW